MDKKHESTKAVESKKQPCYLPDYRWVVEKQEIILRPQDIGLDESISVYPEGLTFAKNGDLLMAACSPQAAKTFIMRSSDRGKRWTRQGILEHKGEGIYSPNRGCIEGMYMTASGRLVAIYYMLDHKTHLETLPQPGDVYFIEGGCNIRFDRLSSAQWGVYSEDEGKTWHYVRMDITPFKSMAAGASSQIFEDEDGTLVASFRGHVSQEELDSGIGSNGIIRSHDGGLSWGDVSIIVKGQPGSGLFYNESQVVPLPDGRWLCVLRLNNRNFSEGPLFACRSYSKDKGYTWSYPVRTRFHGGEPGMGILPDGAIIYTQTGLNRDYDAHFTVAGMTWKCKDPSQSGKNTGRLYGVSYDDGLTWSYWGAEYLTEPGSPEHIGSGIIRPLDEDTAISVYHRGEKQGFDKFPDHPAGTYGPQFIGASWLRKVPADSPGAAGLEYPEWLVGKVLQDAVRNAEKIVAFPEEWHFRFDPDGKGLGEGWQNQGSFDSWDRMRIDISGLMTKHPTRHFPSFSQKPEPRLQNLDIPWYATSFEMPDTGGIPLMILFSGVDGYCDVFIDGRKVGGQELSQLITKQRPFCIPLEKGLPAGRHTMVVRVRKEYPRSAGIFRPVWIVAKSDAPLPPHAALHKGGSLQ